MERLETGRKSGISRNALRTWGILLLALGILSRGIIQNRILGMTSGSNDSLLAVMESSDTMMTYATIALIMEVLSVCAIPIFASLLAEGARNTGNYQNYMLRVGLVALASELPYNYIVSGKLIYLTSQNPALGLLLALVLILFYRLYPEKKLSHGLIRIAVTAAAVLWCGMLQIEHGIVLVLTSAVLWALWKKPMIRNVAGACVVLVCSAFSLFLMAAPMAFLALHIYNGEKGEDNRVLNYLAYPGILIVVSLAGLLL